MNNSANISAKENAGAIVSPGLRWMPFGVGCIMGVVNVFISIDLVMSGDSAKIYMGLLLNPLFPYLMNYLEGIGLGQNTAGQNVEMNLFFILFLVFFPLYGLLISLPKLRKTRDRVLWAIVAIHLTTGIGEIIVGRVR